MEKYCAIVQALRHNVKTLHSENYSNSNIVLIMVMEFAKTLDVIDSTETLFQSLYKRII